MHGLGNPEAFVQPGQPQLVWILTVVDNQVNHGDKLFAVHEETSRPEGKGEAGTSKYTGVTGHARWNFKPPKATAIQPSLSPQRRGISVLSHVGFDIG